MILININCDDYDNLELACQHHLILTLELKDGEVLKQKPAIWFHVKTWNIWLLKTAVQRVSYVWIK